MNYRVYVAVEDKELEKNIRSIDDITITGCDSLDKCVTFSKAVNVNYVLVDGRLDPGGSKLNELADISINKGFKIVVLYEDIYAVNGNIIKNLISKGVTCFLPYSILRRNGGKDFLNYLNKYPVSSTIQIEQQPITEENKSFEIAQQLLKNTRNNNNNQKVEITKTVIADNTEFNNQKQKDEKKTNDVTNKNHNTSKEHKTFEVKKLNNSNENKQEEVKPNKENIPKNIKIAEPKAEKDEIKQNIKSVKINNPSETQQIKEKAQKGTVKNVEVTKDVEANNHAETVKVKGNEQPKQKDNEVNVQNVENKKYEKKSKVELLGKKDKTEKTVENQNNTKKDIKAEEENNHENPQPKQKEVSAKESIIQNNKDINNNENKKVNKVKSKISNSESLNAEKQPEVKETSKAEETVKVEIQEKSTSEKKNHDNKKRVISKSKDNDSPKIIEKVEYRDVKVLGDAVLTFLSAAATGKSYLSWNLAHAFADIGERVAYICLDNVSSANEYFGIDTDVPKPLFNIRSKTIQDIIDEGYEVNKNLTVYTGEFGHKACIANDEFFRILMQLRAENNIVIIDTASNIIPSDVLKTILSYSNEIITIFDLDISHFKQNMMLLQKLEPEVIKNRNTAVINNVYDCDELDDLSKALNKLNYFKSIVTIRNCGNSTYEYIGTDTCNYLFDNNDFSEDFSAFLKILRIKEKQNNSKKGILSLFGRR